MLIFLVNMYAEKRVNNNNTYHANKKNQINLPNKVNHSIVKNIYFEKIIRNIIKKSN